MGLILYTLLFREMPITVEEAEQRIVPQIVVKKRNLKSKKSPTAIFDLCRSLLTTNPNQRISINQVIEHGALAFAEQTLEPQFKN